MCSVAAAVVSAAAEDAGAILRLLHIPLALWGCGAADITCMYTAGTASIRTCMVS